MPRPKTKKELIELSCENYETLLSYINSIPENERDKEFPPGTMNRNIRDVVAHLHHWHVMMLEWYNVGMRGEKPDMPAKGYTWKSLPDLNRSIWEKYRDVQLSKVITMFKDSYKEIHKIINKHTNDELFEKKRYKWTGTTSLGAYLVSATSSHYDWAIRLIKKVRR